MQKSSGLFYGGIGRALAYIANLANVFAGSVLTSVLAIIDGTAAAPGVGFVGSPSTGLFREASGLSVSVAGTKKAGVTSDGLVGPVGSASHPGLGFIGKTGAGLAYDDVSDPTVPAIEVCLPDGGHGAGGFKFIGTTNSAGIQPINSAPMAVQDGTSNNALFVLADRISLVIPRIDIEWGTTCWQAGSGSPEGVVDGSVGSIWARNDGGQGTSIYVKELASIGGDTKKGWTALGSPTVAQLLASVQVDLSVATKQAIYTVPAGKTLIPVSVVLRNASAAPNIATRVTLGADSAASDFSSPLTINTMTSVAKFWTVSADIGEGNPCPSVAAAAAVFGLKATVPESSALTLTVELFGYLV